MTTDGESDQMNQIYTVHFELVILKESVCRLAQSYLSETKSTNCTSSLLVIKTDLVGNILE